MSWDGTLQRHRMNMPFRHLIKVSRQDPTVGFFWCLISMHVLVWTILTSITQPNLPAETLEMLSSSKDFAWGYSNQPPLGVWLATIAQRWAAPANWPVYLLAQVCAAVSVWAAWRLGRKFLHPWTALCAAFVLLGGYSCTIAASAFSGDLLAGAFWSLSIYHFHSALTHERRRYWAATGLFLALGFLSSYGTFLLLVTMFVFTLVDDRARHCWDSSWPFLAGMAMLACLMPHFLWLTQHQFLTVQAGIERSASVAHHLIQPLSYLGTQLLCVIPVVILLTPLVAWFSFEEPARSQEDDREFARRFLLWMTCLPPAIIFGLALVAGPSSGLFAGVTNWSFLGVAVLMWGHLNETRMSWRRSIIRIGAAVGMFAAALVALNLMVPQIQRQGVATQFPGEELSRQIESLWAKFGYSGNTPIVAGPSNLVRNAAWYSNQTSATYGDLNPVKNLGVNDQRLRREGGVIVWPMDGSQNVSTAELQQRFGQVSVVSPVDLNWQMDSTLPSLKVGMAVVHPASAQVAAPEPTPTPAAGLPDQYLRPFGSTQPSFGQSAPLSSTPQSSTTPTYRYEDGSQFAAPITKAPTAESQANRASTTLPPNYPAASYVMPDPITPEPTPTPAPASTNVANPAPATKTPDLPTWNWSIPENSASTATKSGTTPAAAAPANYPVEPAPKLNREGFNEQ